MSNEIRAGDIDVIQYFPPHISRITEFQQIAAAYDKELGLTLEQIGERYQKITEDLATQMANTIGKEDL